MSGKQALHLSNLAGCFPAKGNLRHLKSHLLWVCNAVGGKQLVSSSTMCVKCCNMWALGEFSFEVVSTSSPGPRMRKILSKVENGIKLSCIERSLLKRFHKNDRNRLIVSCGLCKRNTVTQFKKKTIEVCDAHEEVSLAPSSVKKRRKRDRFAGLNASAVLSATPSASPLRLKASSVNRSFVDSAVRGGDDITKTRCSPNLETCVTPKISRLQEQNSNLRRSGPSSVKQKMKLLREEIKQAEQERSRKEFKALSLRNVSIKKNYKLQDFLNKKEKDIHLEDRINSLLQL